jgi:hypothetical protein
MSLIVERIKSEGLLEGKSFRTEAAIQATTASTLALTADSEHVQIFTGNTSGQIVRLPDATTLQIGHRFEIYNAASVQVTVQNNAGNGIATLQPLQKIELVAQAVLTAGGVWVFNTIDQSAVSAQFSFTYPGTGLTVNYTGGQFTFNGVATDIAAGTLTLPDATTNGWIYIDVDAVIKSGTSLPNNVTPLYRFTTTGGAVTALNDEREFLEQNLVWGTLGDITSIASVQTKSAGTSERYARADHRHDTQLLLQKSGIVTAVTFTGNPKKATVAFGTAFTDNNYAVSVIGSDGRSWSVEAKTAAGFTINARANAALTGDVYWVATKTGEAL